MEYALTGLVALIVGMFLGMMVQALRSSRSEPVKPSNDLYAGDEMSVWGVDQ